MEQLTAIELLDEVLNQFDNNSKFLPVYWNTIDKNLEKKHVKVSDAMLNELLKKLEKDGFIRTGKNDKDLLHYYLTIEGEIALSNKGYKGITQNASIAAQQRRNVDKWMVRGTWAAGIAGFLLFLMEIVKFAYALCHSSKP